MSEKAKYRELKNRCRFTTTVNLGYDEILNEISAETRIAKSKLVDEALELLFDKYNKKYKEENEK